MALLSREEFDQKDKRKQVNVIEYRTPPYPLFLIFYGVKRKNLKTMGPVGYGASTVRNSRTLRQGDVDDKI